MRQKFLRFLLLSLLMLVAFPLPVMGQGESIVIRDERTLKAGERIAEDIVVLGGTLHSLQDSEVLGNLVVIAGEADLAGKIDGDVVSLGGFVQLGPTAEVSGDVVVLGTLRRHPEATIYGNVIEGLAAASRIEALPRDWLQQLAPPASKQTSGKSRLGAWLMGTVRTLAFTLGLLLLAAIIASILPINLTNVAETMRHSLLLSFGIGLLTMVLAAILLPILVIICIGIPVAFVLAMILLMASLLAWIAAGRVVGQLILRLLSPTYNPSLLMETMAGTLLISLLAGTGCFGAWLTFLLISWGIGAVILTRAGTTPAPFWTPFGPPNAQPATTFSPSASQQASESPNHLFPPITDSHKPDAHNTKRLNE